ncbi:hypothetical protein WR25_23365 [Diploscapter pachys]|uniref:Uncharacterized protein n=1 Tax=Diploscapter pachys TaxID=2018661 RepID=A0A2A2K210_9BILA|nr:hypothetical protein WR25_23365 [Diploscapter pachys]
MPSAIVEIMSDKTARRSAIRGEGASISNALSIRPRTSSLILRKIAAIRSLRPASATISANRREFSTSSSASSAVMNWCNQSRTKAASLFSMAARSESPAMNAQQSASTIAATMSSLAEKSRYSWPTAMPDSFAICAMPVL